jgi:hypothetical protein
MDALSVFLKHPKFVGLVITEFNADRDQDGSCARQLVHTVTEALVGGSRCWRSRE